MNIIICVDDTDQLSTQGIKGTGDVAQGMAESLERKLWGKSGRVVRHQLLLHPDIAYTSHNSAMSFTASLTDASLLPLVTDFCCRYVEQESEPEADPGLCIVAAERLTAPDTLIEFGRLAKVQVLTMEQAEQLALAEGIHLSRHGGTGLGVIGALAGAGLRLGGNDGAFKDKHRVGEPGQLLTAAELVSAAGVDRVQTVDGQALDGQAHVVLGKMVKSVLWNGLAVIPVEPAEDEDGQKRWKTCSREQIHRQQGGGHQWAVQGQGKRR